MLNNGYNVKGFIDRNANEIKLCNDLPVYLTINISEVLDKEDIVAIILNNGMHHDTVADSIFQNGINKIIYSPMKINFSYEYRQLLRRKYRMLIRGIYENVIDIPTYNKIKENHIRIINAENKNICFWCPISSIKVVKLYLDLFKYLRNQPVDLRLYLSHIHKNLPNLKNSQELTNQWLESRKELFQIYEDAIKYDILFFTDAPSMVSWSEKGYFIILDGNTRAHYLIDKGYDFIPVITSKEDFESWKNINSN